MIAYRVTKQPHKPGEEIVASSYFFQNLPKLQEDVESFLDSVRPQKKPSRFDARYVFKKLADAIEWNKSRLGSILYTVNVLDCDVLHCGDWTWPAKMLASQCQDEWRLLAKNYWDSIMSDAPVVELLVRKAIVINADMTVSGNKQREKIAKRLSIPSMDELFSKKK